MPNLKDLTCTQAKRLSRDLCPDKTDAQIGEILGIPKGTIQRFFTDPLYHPTLETIPDLCVAIGNDILIQWPAAQRGAHVIFPPSPDKINTSLQHYVADITKEFADVLEQDARSMSKDSPGGEKRTPEECKAILRELNQLSVKIEAAKLLLSKKAGQ
jgi:hypothetical protein